LPAIPSKKEIKQMHKLSTPSNKTKSESTKDNTTTHRSTETFDESSPRIFITPRSQPSRLVAALAEDRRPIVEGALPVRDRG